MTPRPGHTHAAVRHPLLVATLLVASACGETTPVTVQGATAASLVRQGVAGLREPTFEVDVPLYGDPAWLKEQNGGTIFAGALVAKPAYDSYNFLLYTNPPAVHFSIFGAPQGAPAGHYEGNLELMVCLDSQCRRPLGGSPVKVPYVLDLVPPVGFALPELVIEAPAGTTPAAQAIAVQIGPGGLDPRAAVTSAPEVEVQFQAPGTILVTPKAAPVGIYQASATVYATFIDPVDYQHYRPSGTLAVTYRVLSGP